MRACEAGIIYDMSQVELFAPAPRSWPDGFIYAPEFLTRAEEAALLAQITPLPFQEAQYREWHARRRIVSYGGRYDFTHHELNDAPPIPAFLHALRARVAQWAALPAAGIEHAMIAEYSPGTPLGWHRDVPEFEAIVGVSLLGHAGLRLRPYPPARNQRAVHSLDLAPRSAYLMRGAVRWQWQHAISPTRELRYSVTFRTRRP